MIRVDAATVLLQWAAGGLFFLWFTTRRRVVGVGYGWLLRGTYLLLAVAAAAAGFQFGVVPVREASSIAVASAAFVALLVSVVRRKAGVSGQTDEHDRRSERVAAMTGIERGVAQRHGGHEFPPVLDLMAPLLAIPGLVAASYDAGGNLFVSLLRTFAGAAFLGSVTDAMLLGHWYLVQPGLPRRHLNDLVRALGFVWPVEIIALLLPIGMFSVWSGSVNDGWGGGGEAVAERGFGGDHGEAGQVRDMFRRRRTRWQDGEAIRDRKVGRYLDELAQLGRCCLHSVFGGDAGDVLLHAVFRPC